MKHLFVQTLEKLSIVLVFLVLLSGVVGGYQSGGVVTAIIGLIGAFIFLVFFFGVLFILLEVNENLRAVRQNLESKQP